MVNTEEFTKRLHTIMEYYDLSAASFADKIDVGRSSISHLLSGRNKPSLDFVMKIINAFPEVELYWLLNGKGSFPKKEKESPSPQAAASAFPLKSIEQPAKNFFTGEQENRNVPLTNTAAGDSKKEIKRIVIFYRDGSFEAFEN